jgi:hypothetical protein
MPNTPIYEIPYLSPNDPPDIAGISQAIAERVEAVLQGQLTQPSLQTNLPITLGTNWSQLVNEYQDLKIGNKTIRKLHLQLQYNGTANIVGGSNSNIADTTLATITNAADRPAIAEYGEARYSNCGGTWQCTTTGVIIATDIPSGGVVSQNDTVQIDMFYLLP